MESGVSLLLRAGAGAAGTVTWDELQIRMAPDARRRALEAAPSVQGFYCAAFPYYAGRHPGNLSLYARGEDYHRALHRRMEPVCLALREQWPGDWFTPFVDSSPFPEVYACARAGLGVIGENGLLITREWGSYVFLGLIATSRPVPPGKEPGSCLGCGACRAACPGQALSGRGPREDDCLSALTQRRGELSGGQRAAIRRGGLVWGCDRCQTVCPHNRQARRSTLPEFSQGLLDDLPAPDGQLSNRAFQKKYGGRAFCWRGVAPLRRNFEILAGERDNNGV